MRSVRTMAIGCIVAVCAMGALSAPAFAKAKEKIIFGKFVASTSGTTRGVGTASKLTIGPYKFTGEQLFEEVEGKRVAKKNGSGEDEFGPLCKSVVAKGTVEEGESESLAQTLTFDHCVTYRPVGNVAAGLKEEVVATFKLGIEFHSNHSATFGEPGAESATIEEGSVLFKGSKSQCTVEIPAQAVPLSSGTEAGMEKEFEAALYETEEESLEGKKLEEKTFGPFRDRLNIETEFKHIDAIVPESAKCTSKNGGEEKNFPTGSMNIDIPGITLKKGNLSFVPPAES
jgi:hypothetical protein